VARSPPVIFAIDTLEMFRASSSPKCSALPSSFDVPFGEGGVMWEKPSRLTTRRPVQVAKGADLSPMHGQMHRLAEAQEMRGMWSPAWKDLAEYGLLL
jgi:hypothetical protein